MHIKYDSEGFCFLICLGVGVVGIYERIMVNQHFASFKSGPVDGWQIIIDPFWCLVYTHSVTTMPRVEMAYTTNVW